MNRQATTNARGVGLLWLLVALTTGLNSYAGKPREQASATVPAATTPAPTEVLDRAALTKAFREQATAAARITRVHVTAELAERMKRDRRTPLAGTDPRKRG